MNLHNEIDFFFLIKVEILKKYSMFGIRLFFGKRYAVGHKKGKTKGKNKLVFGRKVHAR